MCVPKKYPVFPAAVFHIMGAGKVSTSSLVYLPLCSPKWREIYRKLALKQGMKAIGSTSCLSLNLCWESQSHQYFPATVKVREQEYVCDVPWFFIYFPLHRKFFLHIPELFSASLHTWNFLQYWGRTEPFYFSHYYAPVSLVSFAQL